MPLFLRPFGSKRPTAERSSLNGHITSRNSTTITSTILSIVFLSKLLVLIRKQLFIHIQNIRFLTDEAHAACILATFVNLYTQDLRHSVLIVDEITLLDIGFKDNLQALATWCDVDEHNAQLLEIMNLLP